MLVLRKTHSSCIGLSGLIRVSSCLNTRAIAIRHSHSIIARVRDFVFATDKENFHEDFVSRSHKWDKMEREQWTLVYRDIGASRSFFLCSVLLPAFALAVFIISIDVYRNKPGDGLEIVQKLRTDAEELGVLLCLPAIGFLGVIVTLLRVHSLRVLRIYQNRKEVEDFIAICSRGVVAQKKVPFNRSMTSAFYFAEDQTDGKRLFLNFVFGNIQVNQKRLLVMDEAFRGNNYRSYMLNETPVPPRLI